MAALMPAPPGELAFLPQGQHSPPAKPGSAPAKESSADQPARRPAPSFAFGMEDGTPIQLRLSRNLSSAGDKTGDRVDFEIVDDVKVKDTVVIPKGGIAWGTVTEAQRHRRMGRAGKISVKIEQVRLADGEKIPLRAVREAKGSGRQGLMTTGMIATGILFFPAAPLFLFMQGKDITIPKGTAVTAYIDGDTALDPKNFIQDSKNDQPAEDKQPGSPAEIPEPKKTPPQ